jgi:hypothetical protein
VLIFILQNLDMNVGCEGKLTEWFQLPKYGGGEYKFAVFPADPNPEQDSPLLEMTSSDPVNLIPVLQNLDYLKHE